MLTSLLRNRSSVRDRRGRFGCIANRKILRVSIGFPAIYDTLLSYKTSPNQHDRDFSGSTSLVHRWIQTIQFADDQLGRLRPREGLGIVVVLVDVAFDGGFDVSYELVVDKAG